MNLLLHCCCGPCTVGALPLVFAAGYQPFGWYWNRNIQPYQEHKARRLSFIEVMEKNKLPYEASKDYPLEQWLAAVAQEPGARCEYCYKSRLQAAAQKAAELGLPAFSTTLLISPYQNHELLKRLGEQAGQEFGVSFAYMDLRERFRSGQEEARAMGLYMQKYCGCIYTEKERYVRGKKTAQKTLA